MVWLRGGPNRTRSNVPEEEEHTKTRADLPEEEEEHPISSHENIECVAHDRNRTHTRRRSASTPEREKEHPISSHENMQPAAQEDVHQQMKAANEGPSYSVTMSTGFPTTDQQKGPSPESLAQPQLRDDAGKKRQGGELTCSTDTESRDSKKTRKQTIEEEREEGEDLILVYQDGL